MLLSGVEAFLINLDRAPERLAAATRQLDDAKLRWQRVVAIDGGTLNPISLADVDLDAYARNMGGPYSLGEFACAFSHISALKQFLTTDALYGIVFEDDLIIADHDIFAATLEALIRNAKQWDFVKLGGIRNPLAVQQMTLTPVVNLAAPLLKCTGAVGYIVNRTTARKIVEQFFPLTAHLDHQLDQPWRWDIKYRVLRPFVVNQNYGFASTISYSHKKFPVHRRLPTLIYRMANGLKRLRYNLAHGLFLTGKRFG